MLPVLLLAAALAPPPAVADALAEALVPRDARVEVHAYRPALPEGCVPATARALGEVRASGATTVRLAGTGADGRACEGWALVTAKVHAKVLVATRSLAAGEPLASAVALEERELASGARPLERLAPGAVAAWPIPAGAVLTEARVRGAGPRPGAPVTVVVAGRGFTVETAGTAIACGAGRDCAALPSGKRLEGTFRDGKLHVEAP